MSAQLTMACISDFSGLVRGKGFRRSDLDRKVARGIGWVPTNVQITCFDSIADTPYGALGDLLLMPDLDTLIDAPMPDGRALSFLMGDLTDLDGAPWECCTRGLLRRALARFEAATGLQLNATFEQEFMLSGGSGTRGFTLQGFHERQAFGEALFAALDGSAIEPDSFLREYGPDQMEITLPPKPALRAADEATMVREIVRAVARHHDLRASFSPLLAPDIVGNGVHVHFSFWQKDGRPATFDATGDHGLAKTAGAFVAGLLDHLNALSAFTAPSAISGLRMVPHRWSAAFNNLGVQDREASVRICPVSGSDAEERARRFNVEFRAADAAASPYLTLAAIVLAGTLGIEGGSPTPAPTAEDLSLLSTDALAQRGLRPLPTTLDGALTALAADQALLATLPRRMAAVYTAHKHWELAHVASMTEAERFTAYAHTY